MKKLIIFFILLNACMIHAQEVIIMDAIGSNISFEDVSDSNFISIDTNKVWYIAKPQKDILYIPTDHPSLGEYAIFTDTSQFYDTNTISSFQFQLYLDYIDFYDIDFYQKYDFEPNKDGGIIETSYDNGETWQNLLFDHTIMDYSLGYLLYDINDTIKAFNNEPGFTGIFSDGGTFGIRWQNYDMAGDTMLLRFTFASDSVDTENEGWLLDDFDFGGGLVPVENLPGNSGITLFPNPATSYINLNIRDSNLSQVDIVSFTGELLYSFKYNGNESIDISFLEPGIYFIRCRDISGHIQAYKLLKK